MPTIIRKKKDFVMTRQPSQVSVFFSNGFFGICIAVSEKILRRAEDADYIDDRIVERLCFRNSAPEVSSYMFVSGRRPLFSDVMVTGVLLFFWTTVAGPGKATMATSVVLYTCDGEERGQTAGAPAVVPSAVSTVRHPGGGSRPLYAADVGCCE